MHYSKYKKMKIVNRSLFWELAWLATATTTSMKTRRATRPTTSTKKVKKKQRRKKAVIWSRAAAGRNVCIA
jgi:hypothetical protein